MLWRSSTHRLSQHPFSSLKRSKLLCQVAYYCTRGTGLLAGTWASQTELQLIPLLFSCHFPISVTLDTQSPLRHPIIWLAPAVRVPIKTTCRGSFIFMFLLSTWLLTFCFFHKFLEVSLLFVPLIFLCFVVISVMYFWTSIL